MDKKDKFLIFQKNLYTYIQLLTTIIMNIILTTSRRRTAFRLNGCFVV